MKNLKLAVIALAAAGGLSSCSNGTAPKVSMNTKADTVAYAIGLANFPPHLRSLLTEQLGDSTLIDEMIKGAQDGFSKVSKKEKAYAMGYNMGQSFSTDMSDQINKQLFEDEKAGILNSANFLQAFIDRAKGNKTIIEDANTYLRDNLEGLQEQVLQDSYGAYKAENEEFLATNAQKEGVVTTASGLQYKVLTEGEGDLITENQTIKLNYKGTLIDGTEFDSNDAAEFNGTNGLVKGFKEALELMKKGSKFEVYIPQELGYGAKPAGAIIKPFSTLIFSIEILEVSDKE